MCRSAPPGKRAPNSCQLGTALAQKFPQERAMAAALVLAVAADGQVRAPRQRGDELEQPLGARLAHLAPIAARELPPARVGPGLAEGPADELLARRELGQPDVIEVALRVLGLVHPTRRAPGGADAQSLPALPGAA